MNPAIALVTPYGLDGIIRTFGDLTPHIRENGTLDMAWEQDNLMNIEIPFPIPVSGFPGKLATHIYGNKKLEKIFQKAFADVQAAGLQSKIKTYGGCFCFRQMRRGHKLSTHSWGIAIDLNPETNRQGTDGDLDRGIVNIFRANGFVWGGDWLGAAKDCMHLQMASGY